MAISAPDVAEEPTDSPRGSGRRWLLGAIVLAAALPYALKIGADNDLWWHVKTGQLVLEQGALPATDPFSFTATGVRWINHEWLADVALGWVYATGDDRGLSILRLVLLVAFTGLFAAALWRRFPHPVLVLAALLLVMPMIRTFVTLRPQSWTYLFTVGLVWILDVSARRPALLWSVPPLMALWANLHGGFVLGLAVLGAGLGLRWLGLDGAGGRGPGQTLLPLGASVLAPALNPYGFELFPYLVRELGADHSLVLEWRGIWAFPQYQVRFLLLLLVPLAALILARTRRPSMPIAMWVLGAFSTLRHGRFLIVLVIFASLVTFSALASIWRRHGAARRFALLERLRQPRWALAISALPLVAAFVQIGADLSRKGLRLGIDPSRVPVLACEFLARHDLGPNLLLRLDWGGYAIWHLHPRYKVSADGRNLTIYDAGFVAGQLEAYARGEFTRYFRDHDVDVVLVESVGPAYRGLSADPDWAQVYGDALAAVFVPPAVARRIDESAIPAARVEPPAERIYFP